MDDERPAGSPRTGSEQRSVEWDGDREQRSAGTPHGDDLDHPAIRRLHAEFEAARAGISAISRLALAHRARIVEEIRSGLPDSAGRAAHEAGPDATVAEINRHTTLGLGQDDDCPAVLLWGEIVDTATVAASAAR